MIAKFMIFRPGSPDRREPAYFEDLATVIVDQTMPRAGETFMVPEASRSGSYGRRFTPYTISRVLWIPDREKMSAEIAVFVTADQTNLVDDPALLAFMSR